MYCWRLHDIALKRVRASLTGALTASACSGIEQEMQDVAVLDDIGLALGAHLAGFLRGLLATKRDEIVIGDRLGPDEALFEIAVDDACRLRGGRAGADGPGARLLGTDGEIRLQMQEFIA